MAVAVVVAAAVAEDVAEGNGLLLEEQMRVAVEVAAVVREAQIGVVPNWTLP